LAGYKPKVGGGKFIIEIVAELALPTKIFLFEFIFSPPDSFFSIPCSYSILTEVINLNSTDDEDVHSPGREKLHPSGAMYGGGLHTEQLETASHAGLAEGATNDCMP
jgi:hypothetical protein